MNLRHLISLVGFAAMSVSAQTLGTGIDRANMDLTAKPGQDFYRYAGGGWMDSHPLDAEHSRYGMFNVLSDLNEVRLRDIITGLAEKPAAKGSLEQKVGSLYRLAMDSVRLNEEGAAPIMPLIHKLRKTQGKKALFHAQCELARLGVPCLISAYCGADEKDAANNIVQISQPRLTLGQRDYYIEEDEAANKIREAYVKYIEGLFVMIGDDEDTASAKSAAILALETRLAQNNYSAVQLRDPEANYHKMSYADLLNNFSGIDWSTYFLTLGYPAFSEVVVGQTEPLHALEDVLTEISEEDLRAFAEFKVIADAASCLSDAFRAHHFAFFGRTLSGAEQDRPRWKRAVSTVDDVLGEAVGKIYTDLYFPESSKARMKILVNNLAVALGERIAAQSWMSDETKRQAQEKLDAFYVKIGYPDKWTDYSSLEIDESKSFYTNMMNAASWMRADMIERHVGKPVDRDEWFMTPQTINAYYNPTTNEICFPAGILQPPFFNPEADDAANYGAIGVVIGHEMTHGFDDSGSQYDKDGNLNNWWTEADAEGFKARTSQLADYFDNLEALPGLKCNGRLTLGENMADHGGLNVAYQAFQNAMKTNPLQKTDGFTPEQRFFLSYGLIWAGNMRDEAVRQLTKSDPHSLGKWRVNGALPHIDAWYKAFNIKKGDRLYLAPRNRVNVW